MSILSKIIFTDLVTREKAEIDRLNYIKRKLEDQQIDQLSGRTITLSEPERKQLQDVTDILDELAKSSRNNSKADEVCDPLFCCTRTLLNLQGGVHPLLRSHDDGVLIFGKHRSQKHVPGGPVGFRPMEIEQPPEAANNAPEEPPGDVALVALTIGLLELDAATAPPVEVVPQGGNSTGTKASDGKGHGKTLYPKLLDPLYQPFTKAFFAALGEARSYAELSEKVLVILAREGDADGEGIDIPQVSALEFAKVMRNLAQNQVPGDYAQLGRKVTEALNKVQGIGFDDLGDLNIDLPDFESLTDKTIISANITSVGKHIVGAMFDELKVFQAVDWVVARFQDGTLATGPNEAGKLLYKYWRDAPNRMSDQERRTFASQTIGTPSGEPGVMVNRDFNDLWIRFVSSVSNYVRQNEVDQLLRARSPVAISQQQLRKAARDLAGNLTLHGYGMVHFAARELTQQINTITKLLSDPEIRSTCGGAKDMWGALDWIATQLPGGPKTSSRYRTLASCGLIITSWLANNVARIVSPTQPIIRFNEVRFPNDADGHNPSTDPNDYDLVNACELWLAETATTDAQVDELSQPRLTPTMTSIPIPAMAKEMLDGIGDIGLGYNGEGGLHPRVH